MVLINLLNSIFYPQSHQIKEFVIILNIAVKIFRQIYAVIFWLSHDINEFYGILFMIYVYHHKLSSQYSHVTDRWGKYLFLHLLATQKLIRNIVENLLLWILWRNVLLVVDVVKF